MTQVEVRMRRLFLVGAVPLVLAGCLGPLTSRLDKTNEQLALANQQLAVATAELHEANQKLGKMQDQLDEANRTLSVVGKAFGRFPGLRPE